MSAGHATTSSRACAGSSPSRGPTRSVPYLIWGQWTQPMAYRADRIDGIVPVTGLTVLWNIEKKG